MRFPAFRLQVKKRQLEIHVPEIDGAFPKPASGRHCDFKANPHPFGFGFQLKSYERLLFWRDFGLFLGTVTAQTKVLGRIHLDELPSDRFLQNRAPNFDFVNRRVSAHLINAFRLGLLPPFEELHQVLIRELLRRKNLVLVDEDQNRSPRRLVSFLGGRSVRVTSGEELGHPQLPSALLLHFGFS